MWFYSRLPGAEFETRLDSSAKREDLAKLVFSARAICWSKMFDYAPLDLKGIESISSSYGKPKTISELSLLISKIKPGVLEGQLRKHVKIAFVPEPTDADVKKMKADPIDFAFAYFVFCLWKSVFPSSVEFQRKASGLSKGEVRFASSYKGWVVVKKVNLTSTEPKEVLMGLANMFVSANSKIIEFHSDKGDFDSFVSSLLESFPVRKSFAKLPALLEKAVELEGEITKFASGRNAEVLRQQLFLRCFEHAGFPPFIQTETIGGVYPELKIPKPRGNFGGKKKK